jgi:predicted dehydrogenase
LDDETRAVAAADPPSGTLRVGLIGAGDISRYHLLAWSRVGNARVVAVADQDPARARDRADRFGIPASYDDAGEMLAREALDAVDIATWRDSHVTLVRLATGHGAHVLCQKPLAPTLAEAEALVHSLPPAVRLMVHENRRFATHYRTIRAWIATGRIGTVRQAVMTSYRSSLIADPDGRRPSVERAPYFAWEPRLMIGETLIHQLDVLRSLLGPLAVVAARTLRTEPDLPGDTVATILLETPDGAPIVVVGNYVAPGFGTTADGRALGAQTSDRLEIIGSVGSIVLGDDAVELRGPSEERVPVDLGAAYQQCFDDAIAHFADRLRTGREFETSAEDNLATLRLVEDAYAAAARPGPVRSPDRGPIPEEETRP